MRKEVIVAIFVGGIIGILLAFGVWRANAVLDGNDSSAPNSSDSNNVGGNDSSQFSELVVSSPEALSVSAKPQITVSGLVSPNSHVIVSSRQGAEIGKGGTNGAFEAEIELETGVNEILVASFDSAGNGKEVRLQSIYSEGLEDPEQDVEARLEEAGDPLIAYIGTVTDITEGSLQIKDEGGIIRQITLGEDTVYENIIKTVDSIKLTDIAIGDFIVAIGTSAGANRETLESKKILVSEPIEESGLVAFQGEVTTLNSSEFEVQDDQRVWSLDAKGSVQVTGVNDEGQIVTIRLSTVEPGDQIMVVGNLIDNEVDVLAIHLVD